MKTKRFNSIHVLRETYYQLPKFLFNDEFKGLSNNARIAYALLKERHLLSVKNDWVNKIGEVYLNYRREDLEKILGMSNKTVINIFKELKANNLLEEERLGQGKPNRIYLLQISKV
ncbi:MAG: replication initiator protein A [Oscillospiraceae bacterium]|nr:replication initiator protein A [Oscillospiraceae bacterium]